MIDPRRVVAAHPGCWVCLVAFGALTPLVSLPAPAQDYTGYQRPFQADYGGTGLLQTPTARMEPTGEFSLTFSNVDPYTNYAFSFQPFSWMQGGFRYTSISGRSYGVTNNRNYLDKGVDLKFKFWDEQRFRPQVALGFRDFGGTGLFSSEYLVANKRFYDLDFSFGLAWGYLGSRGDIENPFTVFGDRFDKRVGGNGNGDFNLDSLFTGRTAFFGGIQYHTPFRPLTLQVEYEGNDYSREPLGLNIDQSLPVNFGARLRVNQYLTLSGALERGNTAMFGATLNLGLAHLSQPKSNPPPIPPQASPAQTTDDWGPTARLLTRNAGLHVESIKKEGDKLIVEGTQLRYPHLAKGELRANRILNSVSSSDISAFEYRYKNRGFYLREDVLPRAPLPTGLPYITYPGSVFAADDYRRGVQLRTLSSSIVAKQADNEQTLYEAAPPRFTWSIQPLIRQNYGGPDGYLYQILAAAGAQFRTDSHGWLSTTLAYALAGNYDNFSYIAPSDLPRVRTYINKYSDQTSLGVYNLQYTRTARLADNWFAMGYAGLLEQMFGGVGGEVLYRPFDSPAAFGMDVNWVRQRGFDTLFDFRDYDTVEGHATMYLQTGFKDILAKVSAGRYLAKDYGATVDLSRQFESGVRIGAYATYTSASAEGEYGEGGFNKGIYVSIPLDAVFTKSTRNKVNLVWSPLTRDGGASLNRRYTLYQLTDDRGFNDYWNGYQAATQEQ